MKSPVRISCLSLLLASYLTSGVALSAEEHPLYTHMQHWLSGSGDWRTPNPEYDPERDNESTAVTHYSIIWNWDEHKQIMQGELSGITSEGSRIPYWSMFAFYNPATKSVIFQQVGNGAFIAGEQAVRQSPLQFEELEVMETMDHYANDTIIRSKHENIFHNNGCHDSRVFEADGNGNWQHRADWVWCLTSGNQ